MSKRIKSNDLNVLIASLTPTEKRYFRIFASRNTLKGHNIKLELFEQLSQQKSDNSENTKKQRLRNFRPHLKQQLYELIMRSLRNYHEKSSVDSSVSLMLLEVGVLFSKTLYSQCVVLLSKAEKICVDNELWHLNIAVQMWKIKLSGTDYQYKVSGHSSMAEIERSYTEIKWRVFYKQRLDDIHLIVRLGGRGKIMNQKKLHIFKELKKPIVSDTYAHYYFINTKVIYMQLSKKKETAILKIYESFYSYIKTRSYWIAINKIPYINILHNIGAVLFDNKMYEQSIFYLNEIMNISYSNSKEYSFAKESQLNILAVYSKIGDVTSINRTITDAENYLTTNKKEAITWGEVTIYFNIVEACIISGQFKKALKYANIIINKADKQNYAYKDILLLRLLIYWEMKDTDTFHYTIRNTTNFFKNNISKTEELLLKHLTLLLNEKKADKILPLMRSFWKNLLNINSSTDGHSTLASFDFISWTESKMEGRPFSEVLREKSLKKKSR